MPTLKPPFLQTRQAESRKPVIERLYGQRYRVTRRLDAAQGLKILPELFADYGTPDIGNVDNLPALENLCLIKTGLPDADRTAADTRALVLIYETLTNQLVNEIKPVVDYELNGLKRVTCKLVGLPDIDLDDYDFVVGESIYLADSRLILAQFKDESDDAATRITVVYLQPGVLEKSEGGGSIPGTIQHSWQTWMLDATNATEMGGSDKTIPGVLLRNGASEYEGYQTRRFVTMAAPDGGSITGVKLSVPDTVEVRTPGTVELTTLAITAGGNSGTDAIIKHTPPRTKTVDVTMKIEITTTTPAAITKAFDLGSISCSVTASRASFAYIGSDIYTTLDGGASLAVPKWRAGINGDISSYPNCYLVGSTTVTGEFVYIGGSEASGLDTNTIIVTPLESVVRTTLTGTGSTAATGYSTTGIVDRKVRPLETALDGTIYWEVVTWTA